MTIAHNTATGRRVAVMGASGYIGTNLVPRLLEHGFNVRAIARQPEVLQARGWQGVEVASADIMQREALQAALQGIDTAYYLVHCMRAGEGFDEMEREGAQNFARAAELAGVRRIIYLGGLIPREVTSRHLLSRQLTGDLLRQGAVAVTEIRAGIIVGPGCAPFEVIRDLVNHLPVMVTPRWVQSKSPPIALHNLLEYLIGVADHDQASGRIYDVAGPEMLSYEQLLRQYAEFVGKRPRIIPVPVLTPRLSSYWLRLITAVPTDIARTLIDGLKLHIEADDREIRTMIPQQLLTYREAIASVFETEKRNAVAARWTEGALICRNYNPDYAYYAKRDGASYIAKASPQAVWQQVTSIGGDNRYFVADGLWTIRENIDWLLGGPGRNRGRRHPTELRIGDTVDHWRVIGLQENRRLTLSFGLKAPGAAVLEFEITPLQAAGHTRIDLNAYWHPAGTWGIMYWYAFMPFHFVIFNGMVRKIAEQAEKAEQGNPHGQHS